MGESPDWEKLGISEKDEKNLNEIGYTGKLNGARTTLSEYLNSISTDNIKFSIEKTKYDNGDFREEYNVIKNTLGTSKIDSVLANYETQVIELRKTLITTEIERARRQTKLNAYIYFIKQLNEIKNELTQ